MRLRRALVPLLLVATSGLAACGGDDDSRATDEASSSQEPSVTATLMHLEDMACSTLSQDEVTEAVGVPVKEGVGSSGEAATGGVFSTCVWQSDDPDHPADTATLTVYSNTAAADSAREEDSADLEGIGDTAYSATASSVWVYKGERSFFAQWYKFNTMDDEGLQQSKNLAKAVADRL